MEERDEKDIAQAKKRYCDVWPRSGNDEAVRILSVFHQEHSVCVCKLDWVRNIRKRFVVQTSNTQNYAKIHTYFIKFHQSK
mmetsp:Transcript_19568/g.28830  ORF Transcript_19568/g.28830 Transcript_19568/m.28830 type:complete len:81 (+) Transcript_19568:2098-2340(+)